MVQRRAAITAVPMVALKVTPKVVQMADRKAKLQVGVSLLELEIQMDGLMADQKAPLMAALWVESMDEP
jgi:hypothetical protein